MLRNNALTYCFCHIVSLQAPYTSCACTWALMVQFRLALIKFAPEHSSRTLGLDWPMTCTSSQIISCYFQLALRNTPIIHDAWYLLHILTAHTYCANEHIHLLTPLSCLLRPLITTNLCWAIQSACSSRFSSTGGDLQLELETQAHSPNVWVPAKLNSC